MVNWHICVTRKSTRKRRWIVARDARKSESCKQSLHLPKRILFTTSIGKAYAGPGSIAFTPGYSRRERPASTSINLNVMNTEERASNQEQKKKLHEEHKSSYISFWHFIPFISRSLQVATLLDEVGNSKAPTMHWSWSSRLVTTYDMP